MWRSTRKHLYAAKNSNCIFLQNGVNRYYYFILQFMKNQKKVLTLKDDLKFEWSVSIRYYVMPYIKLGVIYWPNNRHPATQNCLH